MRDIYKKEQICSIVCCIEHWTIRDVLYRERNSHKEKIMTVAPTYGECLFGVRVAR